MTAENADLIEGGLFRYAGLYVQEIFALPISVINGIGTPIGDPFLFPFPAGAVVGEAEEEIAVAVIAEALDELLDFGRV